MNANDCVNWNFDSELADASLIECPECRETSPLSEWRESEVGCEDCGTHAAMRCPRCGELFDHVHGPTFKVKGTSLKKGDSK